MTSNGTMANSSKKRKASQLDPDYSGRTPKSKSGSRPKKSGSKVVDDIPFTPECPYKPSPKTNDDVFVQKEEIAPDFEFEFAVRPGTRWKNMRSYRNVKLQEHTFSIGTVIYINKQNPPPKSLRPDATDEEMLKYDRTNFWVGRIVDTRAESDKAVYLRVYWLYWPEELPMGRQSYHGERELVLSNAMDIIDAQTISGAADMGHWDEKDTTHVSRDRFWRQTFDISKLGKDQKGGLSELRKHCRCQQPHNPDKMMYECKKPSCMVWNHEECLVEDLLQKIWPIYAKEKTLDSLETNTATTEQPDVEGSLRDRLLSPVRQLGKMMQNRMTPTLSTVVEQSTADSVVVVPNGTHGATQKKTPKKSSKSQTSTGLPWEGVLKAEIADTEEKDDDSPVLVRVQEVAQKSSKPATKSWLIRVHCLMCGQLL